MSADRATATLAPVRDLSTFDKVYVLLLLLQTSVLGVSIITDQCLPDALEPATVEQIIAVARGAEPRLTALIRGEDADPHLAGVRAREVRDRDARGLVRPGGGCEQGCE